MSNDIDIEYNEFESADEKLHKKIVAKHNKLKEKKVKLKFDADEKYMSKFEVWNEEKINFRNQHFIKQTEDIEQKYRKGEPLRYFEIDLMIKRNLPLFNNNTKKAIWNVKYYCTCINFGALFVDLLFGSFIYSCILYSKREKIKVKKYYALSFLGMCIAAMPLVKIINNFKKKLYLDVIESSKDVIFIEENKVMKALLF